MLKTLLNQLIANVAGLLAVVIAICAWGRMETALLLHKKELLISKIENLERTKRCQDDIIQLLETQNVIIKMHTRDVSNIVDAISSMRETLNTKQDKVQ